MPYPKGDRRRPHVPSYKTVTTAAAAATHLYMATEVRDWLQLADIENGVKSDNGSSSNLALSAEVRAWVADIENSIKSYDQATEVKSFVTPSIFRVPAFIREWKARAFTPQVVSFGPYHYDAENLKPVEEHKRRALVHFLMRAGKPLVHFMKEMVDVVPQLQDFYHGLDKRWRDQRDEFLRLMIQDGCFMLEVLRNAEEKYRKAYAATDPVFSHHGEFHRMPYIKRDMLVFENQLPLLVLQKLLIAEGLDHNDDAYVNKLVLNFFGDNVEAHTVSLGLHPLDMHRKSLLYGAPAKHKLLPAVSHADPLLSATELYEAGVHFRVSESRSLLDIDFGHGTFTLPHLYVDDTTESMLLNIVALEHLHVGTGYEVTSYVTFMDDIIDSATDVTLLHRKGIIKNATGSNEDVARLFGSLAKEVTLDPGDRLAPVRWKVTRYCERRWNVRKWWAHLNRTYFRSPWAAISLAAAIFVILLTVCSTVYSILQFYLR